MNDESKNRARTVKPGALQSDGDCIYLHTNHAIALFKGRSATNDKPEIYGVPRFSGAVGQIWKAAASDDPWADWWLVKIDERIDEARHKLGEYRGELEKLLPTSKNININMPESTAPVRMPLEFGTPSYPYRLAYIISEYDELCALIRGLVHNGLLGKQKSERHFRNSGKPIRAALQSSGGYRFQGVTRNDVLTNNQKAQKAKLLMGDVPTNVFEMKIRSDFAPILSQYQSPEDTDDPMDVDEENAEAVAG